MTPYIVHLAHERGETTCEAHHYTIRHGVLLLFRCVGCPPRDNQMHAVATFAPGTWLQIHRADIDLPSPPADPDNTCTDRCTSVQVRSGRPCAND